MRLLCVFYGCVNVISISNYKGGPTESSVNTALSIHPGVVSVAQDRPCSIYIDYFLESATYGFLFTSCKTLENERVSAANE